MQDQKHYRYEGNIHISPKSPSPTEVLDVSFLTPARIKAKIDGREVDINVGIDLINRKVYDDNGESPMSDQIFEYLDDVNSLPEDFFAASGDVIEQAADAKREHDTLKEELSNGGQSDFS